MDTNTADIETLFFQSLQIRICRVCELLRPTGGGWNLALIRQIFANYESSKILNITHSTCGLKDKSCVASSPIRSIYDSNEIQNGKETLREYKR